MNNDNRYSKLTNKSINRFTKEKYSAFYFAMHTFAYLRERPYLLKNSDYKRLYNELLNFLIEDSIEKCGWKRGDASNRNTMEFLVDVFAQKPVSDFERFSNDLISNFLGYRRLVWALEKVSFNKDFR
jgi:hypothetical protein